MHVKVFNTEIPELAAFDKASALGVPVYEVEDPCSRAHGKPLNAWKGNHVCLK